MGQLRPKRWVYYPGHSYYYYNNGKFPIWDFFRGSYSMLALEAQNIPIWVDSDISDAYIV